MAGVGDVAVIDAMRPQRRLDRPHHSAGRRRRRTTVVLGWALISALTTASCSDDDTPGIPQPTSATTPTAPPVTSAAGACPVTLPRPVPSELPWRSRLFGAERAHGNGTLWVGGLGKDGTIRIQLVRGRLSWKFGWWRSAPGRLRIAGHRLDGPAPSPGTHIPSGYGRSGFQSSAVDFPTEGCWEITGQVADTALTFVTVVSRV